MSRKKIPLIAAVLTVLLIAGCKESAPARHFKKITLSGLVGFGIGDMSGSEVKKGVKVESDREYELEKRSLADIDVQGLDTPVELRLREKTRFQIRGVEDDQGIKTAEVRITQGAALISQGQGKDGLRVLTPSLVVLGKKGQFEVEVLDAGHTRVTAFDGDVRVRRRIPEIENLPPEIVSASPELQSVLAALDQNAVPLKKSETLDFRESGAARAADNTGVTRILDAIRRSGVDSAKIVRGELSAEDKARLAAALREGYGESEEQRTTNGKSIIEFSSVATGNKSQNDAEAARRRASYGEDAAAELALRRESSAREEALRNQQREVRMEQALRKKAQTILLVGGGTLRGVFFEEGGFYYVNTIEKGRIRVPFSSVDAVQF